MADQQLFADAECRTWTGDLDLVDGSREGDWIDPACVATVTVDRSHAMFARILVGATPGVASLATRATWRGLSNSLAELAWRDDVRSVLIFLHVHATQVDGFHRVVDEIYQLRSAGRPVFAWAPAVAGGLAVSLLTVCDLVGAAAAARIGPLSAGFPLGGCRSFAELCALRESDATTRILLAKPPRYDRRPFDSQALDRLGEAGIVAEQLEGRGVDFLAADWQRAQTAIIRRTGNP